MHLFAEAAEGLGLELHTPALVRAIVGRPADRQIILIIAHTHVAPTVGVEDALPGNSHRRATNIRPYAGDDAQRDWATVVDKVGGGLQRVIRVEKDAEA